MPCWFPGSEQGAAYRYEVDNSKYSSQGVLRLRVTGKVGQVTRSIVADMRQNGFLSYVYFTDYETRDPALGNDPACVRYADDNRADGCRIDFRNDTINGPVHSNDRISTCNTTFNWRVTSASAGALWSQANCGANTWRQGQPTRVASLPVPATNAEMKKETRSDLADVPRPGCLYTGPTSIVFNGDGTMTVQSPWTKFTNTTSGGSGSNPTRCGTIAALSSAAGATIPVLDGNLIYVQNVPAADSGDPNAKTGTPANFTCTRAFGDGDGWTFRSTGYPLSGETAPASKGSGRVYGCESGDAFVQGQVRGATTVAAENFVYITNNLTYVDRSRDVLGLVGNNAVWIWNPKNRDGLVYTSKNRTVEAAVMSVAHTFMVQNYDIGPARGTLTVYGSIAQKFRGPVGTGSGTTVVSGYTKNYVYDTRLTSIAPPKFITPVSTTYDTLRAGGVAAAFDASGKAL